MTKTIIIGASGFIGQAIQCQIRNKKNHNSYVFAYCNHPERIANLFQKVRLDLLHPSGPDNPINVLTNFDSAIYVSGNNNHGLGWQNPEYDLDLNVKALLRLCQVFNGNLTVLSSQAVYFGLKGRVDEFVDHCPTIPYAISKKSAELYLAFFYATSKLRSLWIHRLMYSFGRGERPNRLVTQCRKACLTGGKVNIAGGGCSFLNPLPSSFVADILIKSSNELEARERSIETTNINHPALITVLDVVHFLNSLESFEYTIMQEGENQPVNFWGNTERLQKYMVKWKIDFPDAWSSLKEHFLDPVTGGITVE